MESNDRFWERFNRMPVVVILRSLSPRTCYQVAECCTRTGLTTLEVTMNTEGVEKIIGELGRRFPDLIVGAGTVCNIEDYRRARAAGARFIVMPIMDEEVIRAAVADGVPVFPGAFTPTEVYRAWHLGATAVKLFPARSLDAKYIKDVLAPLANIKLLPTGGIDLDNVVDYFAAGAVGVGMGSGLLRKDLIAENDWDGLERHFRAVVSRVPRDYHARPG